MTTRLGRLVDVRPGELRGLLWSFFYFFFLLTGYYILRPLRSEKGIAAGVVNLPWLYLITFLLMLVVVPAWTALVSRVPRGRLLPWVYRFFALSILAFLALFQLRGGQQLAAAVFYVWLSVFNLLVVAVFWGFMADVFAEEQSKRLFGFIAAGGSAGALCGPALTAALVQRTGPGPLFVLAALAIAAAAQCMGRVARWQRDQIAAGAPTGTANPEEPIGGGVLSGLRPVIASPYLAAAAGYLLIGTLSGAINELLQTSLVQGVSADSAARTALFARLEWAANALTLLLQSLVVARLLARFGPKPVLLVLPLLSGLGLGGVALAPTLALVAGLQALRRASAYGLQVPTYGVLFTVVSREEKYKVRAFIDTVVYGGGGALGAGLFAAAMSLGAGLSGPATTAALLAVPWLLLALFLGRRHRVLARDRGPSR